MTRMSISAFQNMGALSERNDDPPRASRPFDATRDGFVFSEGAGLLVFENYDTARQRNAKIYAEVVGYGTSCDAEHITHPSEDGGGAALAMQHALDDAQLAASQVDYINAHGTGTPLGDAAETRAMKSVFGPHATRVSISSTKSQLGHSLGASGGIELVFTVLALQENTIPPTINLHTPDPGCDLDYTPNEARQRAISVAMSNSFGFGGHNASIIVRKVSNGAVG
jgi:3-oxoacyl-[acyl-carrier-protein] synthase II